MVANETGLMDLTLETIWNVYDTLFCEVSPLRVLSVTTLLLHPAGPGGQNTQNTMLTTIPTREVQAGHLLLVKQGNFPQG